MPLDQHNNLVYNAICIEFKKSGGGGGGGGNAPPINKSGGAFAPPAPPLPTPMQEETAESLTSPLHSKRKDVGKGYHSLAENLVKFNELGKLPRALQLDRIDEGQGIETAMVTHEVMYSPLQQQNATKGNKEGASKPRKRWYSTQV